MPSVTAFLPRALLGSVALCLTPPQSTRSAMVPWSGGQVQRPDPPVLRKKTVRAKFGIVAAVSSRD